MFNKKRTVKNRTIGFRVSHSEYTFLQEIVRYFDTDVAKLVRSCVKFVLLYYFPYLEEILKLDRESFENIRARIISLSREFQDMVKEQYCKLVECVLKAIEEKAIGKGGIDVKTREEIENMVKNCKLMSDDKIKEEASRIADKCMALGYVSEEEFDKIFKECAKKTGLSIG